MVAPERSSFSFRSYLSGIGAASLANGIHLVLYPWILVGVLNASPHLVGLAQMALLLPNLLFVLPGGLLSDRKSGGRILPGLYLLYLIPIATLLVAGYISELAYGWVVMFGICFGCITAFVQPARESLIGQIDNPMIQQTVAKVMVVQFMAQGIGFGLSGAIDYIGLPSLLLAEMWLFLMAAWFMHRSVRDVSFHPTDKADRSLGLGSYLILLRQRQLRDLFLVVASNGMLAFGAYMVVVPILVREVYQEGAAFFASAQLLFTLGVVTVNAYLSRHRNMRLAGRWLIGSLMVRGVLLALLVFELPTPLFYTITFAWGLLTGSAMTFGRGMMHSAVADAERSRAASLYQMALFGSAPLGAWLVGLSIDALSLTVTLLLFAGLTIAAATSALLFTGLIRREERAV